MAISTHALPPTRSEQHSPEKWVPTVVGMEKLWPNTLHRHPAGFFSFWKCSHQSPLISPFKVCLSCEALPLVWVLGSPMQWLTKEDYEVLSILAQSMGSPMRYSSSRFPLGWTEAAWSTPRFDFCTHPVLLPPSTFHQCCWYSLELQCVDYILLEMLNSKFQSSTISHQGHDPNLAWLLGQGLSLSLELRTLVIKSSAFLAHGCSRWVLLCSRITLNSIWFSHFIFICWFNNLNFSVFLIPRPPNRATMFLLTL